MCPAFTANTESSAGLVLVRLKAIIYLHRSGGDPALHLHGNA